MARDRKGAQLALELEPALLQRLRAHAAADGRPVSTLVRRWIEAGLSGALQQGVGAAAPDLADLADRLGRLEADVAQMRRPAPPKRVSPAPPVEPAPIPRAGDAPDGAITTAEVADRIGMKRGSLNERLRRAGGARVGLVMEGWRCVGQGPGSNGGPYRWFWEPA